MAVHVQYAMTSSNPPRQISSAALGASEWWSLLGGVFSGPGGVDHALLGPVGAEARAIGFAVLALALRDHAGVPLFERVVVATPPHRWRDVDTAGALREALAKEGAATEAQDGLLGRFERRALITVEGDEVVALAREVRGRAAIFVENAGDLRWPDVESEATADAEPSESDRWIGHVARLVRELRVAVADGGPYVLLDVGRFMPTGAAARAEIDGIEGGQISVTLDDPRSSLAIAQVALRIDEGADGPTFVDAMTAIARAEPALEPAVAAAFRAAVLRGAGFAHAGWGQLIPYWPDLVTRAGTDTRVLLARIASEGGATGEAKRMLAGLCVDDANADELETALAVAARCGADEVEARVQGRLARIHPRSPALGDHLAWRALARGDLDGLERLLAHANVSLTHADRDLLADLLGRLRADSTSLVAIADEVGAARADRVDRVRLALADFAARGRLYGDALVLCAQVSLDSAAGAEAARRTMDVLGKALLERSRDGAFALPDGALIEIVGAMVAQIACHPRAPQLRSHLTQVLSPEVSGGRGRAVLAHLLLSRAGVPEVVNQVVTEWATDDDLNVFLAECRAGVERGEVMLLGKGRLGDTIDPAMARRIAPRVPELLEHLIGEVGGDGAIGGVLAVLHSGVLVCERAGAPRDGLALLRLAAGNMVAIGWPQHARDLVEGALGLAGADPAARRVAWGAYADIHHRLGDIHGAMTGALFALSLGGVCLGQSEVWHEGSTLSRILRDVGLVKEAARVLDHAARLIGDHAGREPIATRIASARLQIEHRALLAAPVDVERSREMARRIADNLRAAVALSDDPFPPLTMLIQQMILPKHGLEAIRAEFDPIIDEALALLPPALREHANVLRAARPTVEAIERVVKAKATTRFAADLGVDLCFPSLLAKRALKAADGMPFADALVLLDLLTDRTLVPAQGRSVLDRDRAGAAVSFLVEAGELVHLLGLDADERLIRLSFGPADSGELQVEPADVFDPALYEAWKERHPFAYAFMDGPGDVIGDAVRRSVDRLGISRLGEGPIAIVPDVELQKFPLNLLRHGDDFLGALRPVASIPSLDWIAHVAARPPELRGRRIAWVSDAIPGDDEGRAVLAPLAERMEPLLMDAGIELTRAVEPPTGLRTADVAIVMAHGGLIPGQRYFQVVSDDRGERWSSRDLGAALKDTHLVVLFVCSAGRLDQSPGSRAVVGLSRRLLAEGCRAVVASPWPLAVEVPPRWLPAFLAALDGGAAVTEAVFAANHAVSKSTSGNPPHAFAMHLFGDPTLRLPRTPRESTGASGR